VYNPSTLGTIEVMSFEKSFTTFINPSLNTLFKTHFFLKIVWWVGPKGFGSLWQSSDDKDSLGLPHPGESLATDFMCKIY
jgi:hypothetical protein